jgi:hypothetical protein
MRQQAAKNSQASGRPNRFVAVSHWSAAGVLTNLLLILACASQIACGEEVRVWSDPSGKFKREAVFERLDGGTVYLKSPAGKSFKVELGKLSEADVEYVEKVSRARNGKPAARMKAEEVPGNSEDGQLSKGEQHGGGDKRSANGLAEPEINQNDLSSLKSLTVEQAKTLSRQPGGLVLTNLTSLSVEVANVLAEYSGDLDLPAVHTITDEAAKMLARHRGNLRLSGLTDISDGAADSLAAHDGAVFVSDKAKGKLYTAQRKHLKAFAAAARAKAEIERQEKAAAEQQRVQAENERQQAEAAAARKKTEFERQEKVAAADRRLKFSLPMWGDYEDLNRLLASFNDIPGDSIELFVRYGVPELAKKSLSGDRFDREEAAEASADHRKGLAGRRFWLQLGYNWDQRDPSRGWEGTVRLRVPLKFRCTVPSGDPKVGVAAYREAPLWFLTKDSKLQMCRGPQEEDAVVGANGILYVPETLGSSELVLWVRGDRDLQKAVAREPDNHVVNIGLRGLQISRPITEGFFKRDLVRMYDYTSDRIWSGFQVGINGPNEAPSYFVTRGLDPPNEQSMPEVVSAALEKVEVVHVGGDERKVVFSWERE